MNSIARRLLGAAAAAVARKLLPDAVPDNPGSALALRSHAQLAPIADRRSEDDFLPAVRPSQILYAPPSAPVQPVYAPAPPPRRRRQVVIETITVEEREW